MKVNAEDLREALTRLKEIVPSRPPIEVLECVLCRSSGEGLELTATDMETYAVWKIPAEGTLDPVCVPLKLLWGILRKVSWEVELTFSPTALKVKTACGKYTLQGLSPDEFPEEPMVKGIEQVQDPQMSYKLASVAWVRAPDFVRTGICIEVYEDNSLGCVATDGRVLSLVGKKHEEPKISLVVPVRVARLLRNCEVGLVVGTSAIRAEFPQGHLTALAIEGKFPNWRGIWPSEFKVEWSVGAEDLGEVLERLKVFAFKEETAVDFDFAEKRMATKGPQGEAVEVMPGEASGEGFVSRFDTRFWLRLLGAIPRDVDRLVVKQESSTAPALVEAYGQDFVVESLIMPMLRE